MRRVLIVFAVVYVFAAIQDILAGRFGKLVDISVFMGLTAALGLILHVSKVPSKAKYAAFAFLTTLVAACVWGASWNLLLILAASLCGVVWGRQEH